MSETLFIAIGYIVFTVYTVGIMAIGALVEKKTRIDKLVCRKLTHIVSALIWIICYFFFGCSIHWVLLNGIGAVLLGIVTFKGIGAFDRSDAKKSYGLFYLGFSTFVTALICYLVGEELYLYTGIAYYCLAIGDGFAPIVAKCAKNHNVEIMPGRTLLGSLTVFVLSTVSALVFNYIFKMGLPLIFVFSVGALTAIAEFYGLKGLDNLLIEFSVFGYLLLYHYGLVPVHLMVVIIISLPLALGAIKSRSLSISGGIAALLLFLVIGFFGKSYIPVLFTAILFVIAAAVAVVTGKICGKMKKPENEVNVLENKSSDDGAGVESKNAEEAQPEPGETALKKHDKNRGRTAKQVGAVGLVAAICIVIYYFTANDLFLMLFYAVLGEQFADSLASDIGRLTRYKNIDIIKFCPVEKGISGGVSVLGPVCALVSSVIFMLIPLLFDTFDWRYFALLAALAFAGTLIDSVLGSLVQALYRCPVCGKYTEESSHCNGKVQLVKGISWIKNSEVNFLSSVILCLISAGILLLL